MNTVQYSVPLLVGTSSNPFFKGYLPESDIAAIISRAVGPSGTNNEYLFNLASVMQTMGVEDNHLFTIEAEVRKIIKTTDL